jgi:hypothetical protein
MRTTRAHYQHGSVRREKGQARSSGLTSVERDEDGRTTRRKAVIGTAEKSQPAAAWKACEHLRSTINQETSSPRTVAELVTHYTEKELPNKTRTQRKSTEDTSLSGCCPSGASCHFQM